MKLICTFVISMIGLTSMARAVQPNGTSWLVFAKACAGKAEAPTSREQISFEPGKLNHLYIATATTDQFCTDEKSYQRRIRSQFEQSGTYTEASTLLLHSVRTICYAKADNKIVSDVTRDERGPMASTSLQLNEAAGILELLGDKKCPTGSLQFELRPIK